MKMTSCRPLSFAKRSAKLSFKDIMPQLLRFCSKNEKM